MSEQLAWQSDPTGLYKCAICHEARARHKRHPALFDHKYERDASLPEWHGWHSFRRGLGSNLYALSVPEKTIQRILRHANVSTTATYYIKTASADAQAAMARLETAIPDQMSKTLDRFQTETCTISATPVVN